MTSPRTEQADTASDHVADAEQALFPPPAALAAAANVTAEAYDRAEADPVAFWEEAARRLDWETPWETSHTWVPPVAADGTPQVPAATWFAGGRLNVAANCVDRHVAAGQGEKVALHFEGEPGDRRTVTYRDLQEEVSRAANAPSRRSASGPATATRSTCPCSSRRSSRPSRSRASARCTRSSSAASPRRPCGSASRTRARSSSSRATGRTGAGRPSPPSRRPTRPSRASRRSSTCSSSAAPDRTCRGPRDATSGGTTPWDPPPRCTSPGRSTPSTRSSSSTPRARPAAPRDSFLRAAATSRTRRGRTGPTSTRSPTTCTGARPTSPGSPRTPTTSTARSRTA